MPQVTGQQNYKRKEISYFDGINSAVASNIAKKEELMHSENVRSPFIGTIEKREGMLQVGTNLTATANHGVFYFNNAGTGNTGLYRSSKVSGTNTIYWLKTVAPVAFTGSGLNDAAAGGTYTGTSATAAFTVIIDGVGATNTFKWKKDSGAFTAGVAMTGAAQTLSDGVTITFTATTAHTLTDQWVINTNSWTALSGSGTGFTDPTDTFDSCVAEGNLYLVNQAIANRYIAGSDGTTVTTSSTTTGNLYRSPQASLINYYKGRLYLADFVNSSNRQKNTILRSSPSLGILALVDADAPAASTVIKVTETKYILPGETIDIRRGGTQVGTLVVTSVEQSSITVPSTGFTINAADEIWVNNTFAGANKVFRWVNNPSYGGTNVTDYDTFKLSSTTDNDAEEIKMLTNVGNVMIIGSNNNLGIWNDFTLRALDIGVGSVSRKGYIKNAGSLFFLHYTGIYQTEGEAPQLISTKVERYMAGATKAGLEGAVAGKKGRSVMFAIGAVTLKNPDGSIEKVLSDVCLEYNIVQKNWYVHTNFKATSMAFYLASADPDKAVMASTFTNYPIVELLASGIYTDLGSEIHMRADTPNLQLGDLFERLSYPLETAIEMERGTGLKVLVSLDMGRWYELEGECRKGLSILKITRKELDSPSPTKCRNIRLSFRHSAKALCKITKAAISFMTSAEEEVSREDETQPKPYQT